MANCDFDCPFPKGGGRTLCCSACSRKQQGFFENGGREEFTDEEKRLVKSLYDEQDGFWTPDGCKLPRHLMPTGCQEFDCKNYVYLCGRIYDDGVWKTKMIAEVPREEFIAAVLVPLSRQQNYKQTKM